MHNSRKRLHAIAASANAQKALSISNAPVHNETDQSGATDNGSVSSAVEIVAPTPTGNVSSTQPVAGAPNKYEWVQLDEFAKVMLEKEQERERDERVAMQRRVREDLDKQMKEVNARRHRERLDDLEFSKMQQANAEKWKVLEKAKEDQRRERAEQEKRDRDEQLRLDAIRKTELQRKHREEELSQVEQIERETKATTVEALARKQSERQLIKKLMNDNERDRQHKTELKKQHVAEELKQLRDYHDHLERQEEERQAELAKRVERQKLLVKRMEEGVLRAIQAKSDDDNIRALKQQAEMDARAIEIQRFRQQKQTLLRKELIDTLKQQIEEKEAQRREESRLREIHSQILQADAEHAQEIARAAADARKQRLTEYRNQLQAQIEAGETRAEVTQGELTKTEISMNKDLLQLVDSLVPRNPKPPHKPHAKSIA